MIKVKSKKYMSKSIKKDKRKKLADNSDVSHDFSAILEKSTQLQVDQNKSNFVNSNYELKKESSRSSMSSVRDSTRSATALMVKKVKDEKRKQKLFESLIQKHKKRATDDDNTIKDFDLFSALNKGNTTDKSSNYTGIVGSIRTKKEENAKNEQSSRKDTAVREEELKLDLSLFDKKRSKQSEPSNLDSLPTEMK